MRLPTDLAINPLKLISAFLKKTSNNCWLSDKPSTPDLLVAEYADAKNTVYVLEGDDKLDEIRDYDEAAISESCSITEDTISLQAFDPRFSIIESLVAAYKFLLQDLFRLDKQYAFARIRLSEMPGGDVSAQYQRTISNKFYQATIYEAGCKLGFIVFGVWPW